MILTSLFSFITIISFDQEINQYINNETDIWKTDNKEKPVNYLKYIFDTRYFYDDEYQKENISSITQFDFDSLTIPIKRAGNLILVECVIDGTRGNLIFDSGAASELVLNKTYFREYNKIGSRSITGINGAVQTVDISSVESLIISEINFEKKYVELIDLSRIENRVDAKILGFFGLELINECEIVIDILNNELQLFKLDRKGNRINFEHQIKYDYTQNIELSDNVMFIWAKVAGKNLRFCFDTAAEKNIISHIAPKKTISSVTITGRAKIIDPTSRNKEVLYGKMNDFLLGKKQIKNMETLIANIGALSKIYKLDISGVLGFDFLSQGKITINTRKKQFGINFNKENQL